MKTQITWISLKPYTPKQKGLRQARSISLSNIVRLKPYTPKQKGLRLFRERQIIKT